MKVLLVGSLCDDKWIGSLIRMLKKTVDNLELDFFHVVTSDLPLSEAAKFCDNVYVAQKHFPEIFYKFSKFGTLLSLIDVPLSINSVFKSRCSSKYYDVVNIHYPQNKVLSCWKIFALVSKVTIITPWGSEILRISRLSQRIMASYMAHYDYIMSSDNPRFKYQLQQILNIPDNKFVACDFGSEMIDEICNSSISKDEAKKHFGIEHQYTIVCGYNGGVAQNHLKIIEAISRVRNKLPKDLVLVLPMTYNTTLPYLIEVQQKLEDYNIDNVILENYLSNHDMVCLRKCADMFIHAQSTDANSVSLAEHLLCGSTVINANWLRYENREIYGLPYYLFGTFEKLPDVILKAYEDGTIVSDELMKSISKEGWDAVIYKWVDIFKTLSN